MVNPKIEKIATLINSAIVEANYDGFQIKVSIFTKFDEVECACYLYSNNTVSFKSGYKHNNKHVFYTKENSNFEVKVFFRYKEDSAIKKTKLFAVSNQENIRYRFSKRPFDSINLAHCEIINSKSGAIENYEINGFKPRGDSTPYKLNLPLNWLEDPFNDRNWMFQLHAWRMLDAYLSRGDIQDLDYVSKIINDWTDFEKNNESKWLWYDMSTGLRALKICFYLKKCYELGVDHKIEALDYLLHEHLKHLSNPDELNPGNHGLFQLQGLKSLTYILDSCSDSAYDMSKMRDYANEQMKRLVASQLGQYGVHTEDSPDYHFFTHKKIKNIVASPWWSDLNKDILEVLEWGEYAKPWLVFPNYKCVSIGDSSTGAAQNKLESLEKWPHTKYKDYIGARVDGYAIVRSLASTPLKESSFLFFQGSFYSQAHKHCDDLSFILQEKGVNLLIDSGKYGYQQDKYRKYFLSTQAHNTIEVDGKSTMRIQEYAYGSAILGQPKCIDGIWIIKGKVDHIANDYIHERIILYKPGIDLYVIDTITNKKSEMLREVNQWWHFDTDAEVFINENEDKAIVSTTQNTVMEITSQSSSETINYHSYKGYESKDQLIGWVSKSYLKYEPTSTLKITTTLKKRLIILTRFKLDKYSSNEPIISLIDGEIHSEYEKLL